MAIELVTGRAGTPHVDSSDMRALYAEIVGRTRYLLNDYEMGVAEMESANDCHLMPAELLVDGAHVRITGDGETVHIDNGSSSYDRVDVVALHYVSTGSGDSRVESISLEVVKGTPVDTGGDAKDPAMPSGSATILDGSTDVYIPYVRVKLVGLSPQDPELIISKVNYNLSTAGIQLDLYNSLITSLEGEVDGLSSKAPYVKSKSATGALYAVTVVRTVSSMYLEVMSASQVRSTIGREPEWGRDFAVVVNGDEAASTNQVHTLLNISTHDIDARVRSETGGDPKTGSMRLDVLIYAG